MEVIHTDVLVIGGGLAGQRAAIGARRRGHQVVVLSLVPAKRSHSAAAQGGMQASLGNCLGGAGDNEDLHFADTVRGSDWGADGEGQRLGLRSGRGAHVRPYGAQGHTGTGRLGGALEPGPERRAPDHRGRAKENCQ